MVGYFSTEFGPLNQVVHMWAYASHDDRNQRRQALGASTEWQAYRDKVQHYLVRQENKLLVPASFSPRPDLENR